ncbi:NCS2 family permease [Gordonia westfalica]|uniref:Putative MFS transporter, AGZA family, xanthine/uracil permease n=1 Tax=Gordonia westfalica TaxID=158898 RepID=A0A1H2JQR1_9ACTN|nr:NCS2 family permease [Gordonia westfalica]SDU58722.1 putative MFS transporter, AGZA family, xanthine/uracil permease [Gordonia westfalica]
MPKDVPSESRDLTPADDPADNSTAKATEMADGRADTAPVDAGPATTVGPASTTPNGRIDRFFKISERGSTLNREFRGGLVTFFTMAYIVVLNPIIIGGIPGGEKNADVLGNVLPLAQVAAVTALVAGVMSILFGLVANYPFAIAAGLGINSLLAVSIAPEVTWPEAMGLVVVDGIIIVLLAVTGFRTAVFNAVPSELKAAIAAGIGAFIAFIGFVDAGFVKRIPDAAGTTVPVQLGSDNSIATIPTLIFALGVLIMGVLVVRKVPGGLLIGIAITTVLSVVLERIFDYGSSMDNPSGWGLTVPDIPTALGGLPDLSLVGDVDLFGAFTRIGVLAASVFVFALVLSNFFDAMGTMTGLGKEAGLADEKGNLPGIGRALVVEGTGAIAGGAASASSNTVFVESASGIAEGARTGLANVVTGVLFLVAMFLTPIYEVIPLEAIAPALVVVGAMMIGQLTAVDFRRFDFALPAFLTVVTMPFTYSIANGIGIGFISWVVMATAAGKARSVHPLLWLVAAVFVAYFARGPISDLIG